jgi:alpha-L-rhamnosidase
MRVMTSGRPTDLRVEHLDEPFGIDVARPRLSWKLPPGTKVQEAYQVVAGTWDSGLVRARSSLLVSYGGPPLASRERVPWRVKVLTDAGESAWSEEHHWEMGLLAPGDWHASWIEPQESDAVRSASPHPAYVLQRPFVLADDVLSARLYATAHGIYELFLNGDRVGDLELTPGFTSYWTNLQVQTFDVTHMLRRGENVVRAVLSDGWYRGQTGGYRQAGVFGDSVALLAQLEITTAEGTRILVATDGEWRYAVGAIVSTDLMEGQVEDRRADELEWTPVALREYDGAVLCASPAPPVRRVEEIHARSVTQLPNGRQIVDLGQNINGWLRLQKVGAPGTTVTLTHGEALDANGDVTQANILVDPPDVVSVFGDEVVTVPKWMDFSPLSHPLQVDAVTWSGSREPFEPRHTTHGFQYVRIEGHSEQLRPEDVVGVVVHTDLRRTGSFECSDDKINKLHDAAVWGFRGNACDIPTDCPTRERAGWTGDWQVFVSTAAFLFDVAGFSRKWLRDVRADQDERGLVAPHSPNPVPIEVQRAEGSFEFDSAAWGDAAAIVPWEIYRAYGDEEVLREQWDSMVGWVEFAARSARENRSPKRVAAAPVPLPHEEFIWDSGVQLGDWCKPGDTLGGLPDNSHIATAYLCHTAGLVANIAAILELDDQSERYRALAESTRRAWQIEFMTTDGSLRDDTQTGHVFALAFDLVPDELRPAIAARLASLVREADTHPTTGFLATPHLLPVLADAGYVDLAYDLLFQETAPAWLAMLDRGATTIWESWEGADANGIPSAPDGLGSLNHYSKGAVVSFLHRYVAGIEPLEPGYRRFRVAPLPGERLQEASAWHDSPYGRIESSWRREGVAFALDVVVPPGTQAEVVLPSGARTLVQPGEHRFDWTAVVSVR